MKKTLSILFVLALVLSLNVVTATPVAAGPGTGDDVCGTTGDDAGDGYGCEPGVPPPHGFAGTVSIVEPPGPVSEGTPVEAYVNGVRTASTTVDGQSRYVLLVPGTGGATVTFRVGGVLANESAIWVSGRLDKDFDLTIDGLPVEEIPHVYYTLTISSSAGGSVTTPGEGTFSYDQGTVVNLVATPDPCGPDGNWMFVDWTGDVATVADVNAASTTITMEGDYSITANFEEDPWRPAGCFIATAAYGTPSAGEIDVLREFRDTVLLESAAGSRFVTWYYQTSPPIAEFLAGNEFLRTLVREFLVDPVVWLVEATGTLWRN